VGDLVETDIERVLLLVGELDACLADRVVPTLLVKQPEGEVHVLLGANPQLSWDGGEVALCHRIHCHRCHPFLTTHAAASLQQAPILPSAEQRSQAGSPVASEVGPPRPPGGPPTKS